MHDIHAPEALLHAADGQLYRAKAAGRHQTCGAELAPQPPTFPAE